MLACNCLNVIIEPETNDFVKVTSDSLELSESEKKDSFFSQEIQQLQKLSKIVKKVSALISTRIVGSRWIVHHCINCNMHTHAVHRDRGAAFVLVSSRLLSNEAIEEIKNSKQYSSVFDIKITGSNSNDSIKPNDIILTDSDAIISSLRQRVNECINRETVAVEERIRKYTEDQYKALDEFRDRVFKEHHILKMKILDIVTDKSSTNIDTNLSLYNLRSPIRSVPENNTKTNAHVISKPKSIVNNKSPIKKLNSDTSLSGTFPNHMHSFDSEVLFPLEDMEDDSTYQESDFEESDQEDISKEESSESIQRPRQSAQLAKSLPVNIPIFMSTFQNHINEDNDDELPDESMDIAASIKALAKSIQGGTVFGELPRPRFSSQI